MLYENENQPHTMMIVQVSSLKASISPCSFFSKISFTNASSSYQLPAKERLVLWVALTAPCVQGVISFYSTILKIKHTSQDERKHMLENILNAHLTKTNKIDTRKNIAPLTVPRQRRQKCWVF
jgi:hypothetical protein